MAAELLRTVENFSAVFALEDFFVCVLRRSPLAKVTAVSSRLPFFGALLTLGWLLVAFNFFKFESVFNF